MWRMYLNICHKYLFGHSDKNLYEYIQTFIRVKFFCTNIFKHSWVSVLECKMQELIQHLYTYILYIHTIFNTNIYSDILVCQICLYEYIKTFVYKVCKNYCNIVIYLNICTIFNTNIFSDICLCQFFVRIYSYICSCQFFLIIICLDICLCQCFEW